MYHFSFWRKHYFFLLFLWLLFPMVVSADAGLIEYQIEAYRTFESVEVDGEFNEADWQNAKPVGQFTQVQPDAGAPGTQPTEARVLYDNKNLYFGFTCFEADMSKLTANDMRRDSRGVGDNDTVFVLLDTYNDKQSGVYFSVNALGARIDMAISDSGSTQNRNWDAVWTCGAKVNEDHWAAEIAIPFSQLRFNQSDDMTWGINVGRDIRRHKEKATWVPMSAAYGYGAKYRTANIGTLVGLKEISPSRHLELLPYVSPGFARDDEDDKETKEVFEVGLDLKYGITHNLTGDLTFNTDFAQVETDEEQVNLTRFSLFFPEKRPFFLEGAGLFEIGIPRPSFRRPPPLLLFYSRRIGIEEGHPIPIIGGGKITGRIGDYGVGLLNVLTDEFHTDESVTDPDDIVDVGRTNYSVLRVTRNILQNSNIGLIAVNKEDADRYNRTAGFDFVYRPRDNMDVRGYWARTFEEGMSGRNNAWYLRTNWQNKRFSLVNSYTDTDEDFNPEVGFVRREGIRRIRSQAAYTPWPRAFGVRQIRIGPEIDYFFNQDNDLETREITLANRIELENGFWVFLNAQRTFEGLDEDFDIREKSLFDLDLGFRSDLEGISENLRQAFKNQGVALSQGAAIEKEEDEWVITDANNNKRYRLTEEKGKLEVRNVIAIPIGEYHFNSALAGIRSDDSRMFYGFLSVNFGDFFNGQRRGVDFVGHFKPNGRLSIEPRYQFNRITLPTESFDTNVFGARVTYSFSTFLFTKVFAQWNSVDDVVSTNFLLNYIYRPGSDFFLVFNQTYASSGDTTDLLNSTVVAKMTYWWNP